MNGIMGGNSTNKGLLPVKLVRTERIYGPWLWTATHNFILLEYEAELTVITPRRLFSGNCFHIKNNSFLKVLDRRGKDTDLRCSTPRCSEHICTREE
jgi:hypothetical protein